ncbi:LysR family transcriptional regulator [Burkholderia gladioli pv. alliicola]|uniref:LysR family transcriptional regulator n=1 Tax=Burkholderia gladioli TaxID=28095 RepID=UPI003D81491B
MLRELKTFLAVAKHGTFSAAAARIGITQSAVSSQIQRVEEQLGVALFDRSGRTPHLTKAGQEALVLAAEMMALHARLLREPSVAENTGTLRIGAVASAQGRLIAGPVTLFREAFPAWRVEIVTGGGLALVSQIDAGEIDLAVMSRPNFTLPEAIEWRRIALEPFVLLAPERIEADSWREAIGQAPFIRCARHTFAGQLVDQFLAREGIRVDDAIEVVDFHCIAQLVSSGAGLALVPRNVDERLWPGGVKAFGLGDRTFHRELGIVQKPRHGQHPVIQKFVDEIDRALAAACDPDAGSPPPMARSS